MQKIKIPCIWSRHTKTCKNNGFFGFSPPLFVFRGEITKTKRWAPNPGWGNVEKFEFRAGRTTPASKRIKKSTSPRHHCRKKKTDIPSRPNPRNTHIIPPKKNQQNTTPSPPRAVRGGRLLTTVESFVCTGIKTSHYSNRPSRVNMHGIDTDNTLTTRSTPLANITHHSACRITLNKPLITTLTYVLITIILVRPS